jgi:hypothetical protein
VLPDVVRVELLGGRRLRVAFDDGVQGEVDLDRHLEYEGVFEPLLDPGFFAQVRVPAETGTIEWPNGADIDPVVLRCWVTGEPLPDWVSRMGEG